MKLPKSILVLPLLLLIALAFLRGHVAQLTQSISQFALKPGEEEIKKKGWWQFWRRG